MCNDVVALFLSEDESKGELSLFYLSERKTTLGKKRINHMVIQKIGRKGFEKFCIKYPKNESFKIRNRQK
jgi:phage antirepressor YoqD-like protein